MVNSRRGCICPVAGKIFFWYCCFSTIYGSILVNIRVEIWGAIFCHLLRECDFPVKIHWTKSLGTRDLLQKVPPSKVPVGSIFFIFSFKNATDKWWKLKKSLQSLQYEQITKISFQKGNNITKKAHRTNYYQKISLPEPKKHYGPMPVKSVF